jgi:murein DD-endopeptidase MepM/ murein hydrolase activator NlpD
MVHINLKNIQKLFFIFLLFVLLASCKPAPQEIGVAHNLEAQAGIPTQQFDDERVARINEVLQTVIQNRQDVIAFVIYTIQIDHVDFSQEGSLALVWLAMIDPDSGSTVSAETGLAIARLAENGDWEIVLQPDPDWVTVLNEVPEEMLPADIRTQFMPDIQSVPHDGQVYTGYRLPWAAGLAKTLTGSIGHVYVYKTCPSSCLYAFDFADGTNFHILAAKAGTVKYVEWRYPNGNTKHANYIVLEDTTTTPTTYQVYNHLAQDSVPAALRVIGAYVVQGQFIGDADDTGVSSGSHLHFHVHTNPNSYWGNSVDIRFDEVAINGGRPRTCAEAANFPAFGTQCQAKNLFISQNGDNQPPTGIFSNLTPNQVITAPVLDIAGQANDDTGIASIQLLITYDGNWQLVGSPFTTNQFSTQVDLCQAGIPDGAFFLAMRVTDAAGKSIDENQTLLPLTKTYSCTPPPPQCAASSSQVILYTEANFSGQCKVLDLGSFEIPSLLAELGSDHISSIQVGVDVLIDFSDVPGQINPAGILLSSEQNLINHFTTLPPIINIFVKPPYPHSPILLPPANALGNPPTDQDDLILSWEGGENGTEFHAELSGPNGYFISQDFEHPSDWNVGKLAPGDYQWVTTTRNIIGENQASLSFRVALADLPPSTQLISQPSSSATTALLLTWNVSAGAEDIAYFEIQYQENSSNWINWEQPLPSSTRQAWFFGEFGKTYQFRIRGVDIKGNVEEYPASPDITIQINNNCSEDDFENLTPEDSPSQWVTQIDINQIQEHNFCQQADEDWFIFPALKGHNYRTKATPLDMGVTVNLQVYGNSQMVLLDESSSTTETDPASLDWTAPEDGLFYLRLRPANNRLSGTDTHYAIKIEEVMKVYPTTIAFSAILLPLIWAGMKISSFLRSRFKQSVDK